MPNPSTRQSYMKVYMGKAPAVDDNHIIDDMAFKLNIVNKTADYTVLASESGTFFTNVAATGGVNYTLPTKADGLNYWFFNCVDFELMITSDAADTLATFNDATADTIALTQASEHIGGGFHVFCDGTTWLAAPMLGAHTQTIAVVTA